MLVIMAGLPATGKTDRDEHRRRAQTRVGDIEGLPLPTWEAIEGREYEPWDRERLVVDTAGRDLADCVAGAVAALTQRRGPGD